uniref:PHD-type domain-containing protein n=1 Tax=Globodera pallida TaxID=36090 RepID=A0A183CLH2_GLOPA
MVDVFIQKLDKETSSFNSFAECVQRSNGRTHSSAGTSKDSTEVKARTEEQQPPVVNRRRGTAPASSINSQSLKRGTAGRTNAKETANLVKNEATEPNNIGAKGDMPIDPNEPRYCFCQQVSFGHMVACDNKDCSLEWFHFDCVDLKASPKGKWFCPKCRDDKDSTRRQQQQTRTPKSGVRGKDIPSKQ